MPRDFSTLASLLRSIPPAAWRGNIVAPDVNLTPRFVASDHLEDLGRRREAAILRDPRRFAFWDRSSDGTTLVEDASDLSRQYWDWADYPFARNYLQTLGDAMGEAYNTDVPLEIEPFLRPGIRAAIAADAFHFLGSNADLDPRVRDLLNGGDAFAASRNDERGWWGAIAGRTAVPGRAYLGTTRDDPYLDYLPQDVREQLHAHAVSMGPYSIYPRRSLGVPDDWWEFATNDGAPPGGPFLSGTYEVPDLPPLREGEDYSRYTQYEANMPSSDLPFVPDYVPQGRGGDHTPYGSADWADLHTMLRAIGPRAWRGLVVEPDVDMTPRLVAADFMTELGRPREGAVLRDTRRFAYPKGAQGIPLGVMDATDLAAEYWGNAVAGRPVSRPDSISARNWVRHLLQEYDDRNPGFLEAYDDPWDALNLTSLAAMLADSATWGALAPWPGPAMPPGTIGDLRNGMNSDVINRRRGWPTADVLDDPDLRAFAAELGPYALEENESTHDLRGPYEVPMWPQLREGEDYARYDDLDYDCGLRPCLVPDAITALRTRLAGRNNRPAPPTPYDPVTEYAYTGSAAGDGDATSADNDYGLQQSLTVGGTMPLQPQFGSPSQANADPQAAVQQDTASLGITPEMIQQVLGGTARPMPTPHASLPYEGSDFPMGVPPMSYGTGDWASLDAILRAIPRAAWRGTESGADLSDVSEVPPLREGDYDGEEAPTDYATPNTIHQMIAARTRGEDVPDMALGDALMEIGHPLAPETVQRAAQRGVPLRDAALGHLSNPALTHAILGLQDSMHGVAFPRHHGRFGPRRGYGGPGDPGAFAPTHVGRRWIDPYQFLFTPEMAAFNPSGEVAESALALYPNTAHPFSRMLMTLRSMSPFFEDMTAPPDHEGVMPGLLSAVVRPWEALGLSQHMPQPHQDDIEQWFEENVPTAMNDLWHARAHHGRWRTDIPEWDEQGIAARERGDEYDGEEAPAMYSTPETLHRLIQDRITRGDAGPPDMAFGDAMQELGHPLAAATWERGAGGPLPAHVLARLHLANPELLHAILGLERKLRAYRRDHRFGDVGYVLPPGQFITGHYVPPSARPVRHTSEAFPESFPFSVASSWVSVLPHLTDPLNEMEFGLESTAPLHEWPYGVLPPLAVAATVAPHEIPGLARHLPRPVEDRLSVWAQAQDLDFDWDTERGEPRQYSRDTPPFYYGLAEELQAALRAMPPRTWRGTLAGDPSEVDTAARGIGADMLQELGRLREALILRDPRRFAYLDFGGSVNDAADLLAPMGGSEQWAQGGHGWGTARPDNFTEQYLAEMHNRASDRDPDFVAMDGDINRRTLAAIMADAHHFRAIHEHLHPMLGHMGRGGLFERARNDAGASRWFAGAYGTPYPPEVNRALDEYAESMGPYYLTPHTQTSASGSYEVPSWTDTPPIPQDPDPANYAWHGVPVPVPEMPGRQPDRFKLLRAMLPPRPLGR